MIKRDKTFEYQVAEYMITRFLDYIDSTAKDIILIRVPRKSKTDPRKLSEQASHLLTMRFADYIDKRLNKPIVHKKYGRLDKAMSRLFKNR